LTGPPLSGAAHSRLHFVHDEHDSVLAADPLQFLQEELGRRHVSTFALNGLDDDARDVFGIEQPLENLSFKLLEYLRAAGLRSVAVRAAISVRVGNVLDSAEQRAKSFALRRFRCRLRERAHGPAMEAAVKRNHLVALRGVSRKLDAPFNRLCPRISVQDFLAFRARPRSPQAL